MDAIVTRVDDRYELRFERRLRHGIAEVWAALTEPGELARWLAPPSRPLTSTGAYELRFDNTEDTARGEVTRVEPPTLLECTWTSRDAAQGSVLRWELRADGDGCRLVLTHVLPAPGCRPELAAGWHGHLDALADVLAGGSGDWPDGKWQRLRGEYATRIAG
jgi:uncharacterized protein YndB with AHSA1/START domain